MRCPSCQFENPPGFKFCGECATALTGSVDAAKPLQVATAPVSYTPTHLAERIRAAQSAPEARGSTDSERKTIWFTEGFDTRDLQEVKVLLDALS